MEIRIPSSVVKLHLGSLLSASLLVGCASIPRETRALDPTVSTPTPLPTQVPTATHTPTPTAEPITVVDARPSIPQNPNPLGLITRCGVADVFDYPLDPPDAETVRGGRDFGVYRDRYEGFHTGEDWWYERRNSLGKPVYSAATGRVRYAAANGWGDDLGTLVLEHILPNGRRLYSFYGHLDPKSLKLRVGQCVTRGEQVGLIGDPRSSPHLHFEIRYIFADSPGPGYWSVDPALSGWLPPSQTIEGSRYDADDRVVWWRSISSVGVNELGWLAEDVLLFQEGTSLIAIDVSSGEELYREDLEVGSLVAAWSPDISSLILVSDFRTLQSIPLTTAEVFGQRVVSKGEVDWEVELEGRGRIQLALIEDIVIILRRDTWTGYRLDGSRVWELQQEHAVESWIPIDGGLILLSGGDLWRLTREGGEVWEQNVSGKLIKINDLPYLYAEDGLYAVDRIDEMLALTYPWNQARLEDAAAIGLDQGRMLALHRDGSDRRLIELSPEGTVSQDNSLRILDAEDHFLVACAGRSWLLTEDEKNSSVMIRLYLLDENGRAEVTFQSMVRATFATDSVLSCIHPDRLLLSLGGRRQVLLALPYLQPN